MSSDNMQVFADEAEDLLALAEQALLTLEQLENKAEAQDCINDLFRTFHTIKGAAGLFGLDDIVNFTHIVESVLVKIREGLIIIDEKMVFLLLANCDHLQALVQSAVNGDTEVDPGVIKRGSELVSQLNTCLGSLANSADDKPKSPSSQASETDGSEHRKTEHDVKNENWHISLRFGPNTLRNGMDPASFIAYLRKVGEIQCITLIDDALPEWPDFDPEACYLGFEIELLAPDASKEIILEVFEFVQDDSQISILPPHSHIEAYIKLIEELPEPDLRIGDMLVACGALTADEKDRILCTQDLLKDELTGAGSASNPPPLGEIAVKQQTIQQEVVDAALQKQRAEKRDKDDSQKTVRVNAKKLESLVNLVGELVIGSANAEVNSRRAGDAVLIEAMENVLRLVEEVRDTALGLRMVQIGDTFNRFNRVVREVSRDLGKNIRLVISGAETELDKTLIDRIGDPLMHLIRNAIDHGIESPDVRLAQGKPAEGLISLNAFHDSGSIVIQIKDDGQGLPKDKILAKAIEKGIVQAGQHLTDQEIYRLIFEAGFSTAATVSNLSGRGVGMDVVRSNIYALRGQVEIDSQQGQGSTMSIRLPLTLAIIDGFQVRVGSSQYIVPLDMVEECIELTESLKDKEGDAQYINLRGEILPFVHLSDVFDSASNKKEKHRDNIVVVKFANRKAGFVVDELLGEHQTVIKPLGKVFRKLKGISGATILGSGEVAMILDIAEMVGQIERSGLTLH